MLFIPFCVLFFYKINDIFGWIEIIYFKESQFINYFLKY